MIKEVLAAIGSAVIVGIVVGSVAYFFEWLYEEIRWR